MPDTTNNEGYLVQLRSPEGDNVYPIISAEMIKDSDGSTYDLSGLKEAVDGMGTTYATKTELEAVSADVEECFQSVSEGKALIAAAVTDRGVPTAATDSFQTMANNIAQISAYVGYGYNVTIVDNNNNPVPNQTVQCTTNGSSYTTNSSGQITTQIDSTSASLTFTWSTSSTAAQTGTQIDGSLYGTTNITTIHSYTASINGTVGQITTGRTNTTISTSSQSSLGDYCVNVSAATGNYVTIGTRQYLITHTDSSNVYVALRYWEESTQFGSNTAYSGSTIANKCTTWYNDNVPALWKTNADAFNVVTVAGVTAKCFIPAYTWVNGGWPYFNNIDRRIFTDSSGHPYAWWTSTAGPSGYMWRVDDDGNLSNSNPGSTYGFRPCLAIKRSLFTS